MKTYIFDKSDKGRDELATRKYHLTAKMRALLVMIDGQRPIEVLMKNFSALGLTEENVTELQNDGFIDLIDKNLPPVVEEPVLTAPRVPVSAKARLAARRAAGAARAHDDHHDADEHGDHIVDPHIAARDTGEGERMVALQHFYSETIKSTLGLRGMLLQLKVDKCVTIDDYRELRDVYLEAIQKAQGREMSLSLQSRLDALLGTPQTA